MISEQDERYPLRRASEPSRVYHSTIFNDSSEPRSVELDPMADGEGNSRRCCPVKIPCLKRTKISCNIREEARYEVEECFPYIFNIKQYLINKVPFIWWLRKYKLGSFISDVVAGLTVGLMVVPQALAYAKIAGLKLHVMFFITLSVPACVHVYVLCPHV